MENFKLNINERVEVLSNDKEYKSLILDVNEEYIYINIPVFEEEYLIIDSDETIQMNVYLQCGRCYNFSAKVLLRGRDGNISYYKLSKPFNIKRIQRREYFRVGVLKNAHYTNITNCESDEIPYVEGVILDLSGSGVKLEINEKVKTKDILLIKMRVKNSDIIVKGEVVRVEVNEDGKKICGIKFIDITQSQTDKIIEELFVIMRKQRELT